MDEQPSKIKEIGGLFIFILIASIISWLGIYFEVKEALSAFLTSVFFLYVIPTSRYASMKNIIGSYLIASLVAFLSMKFLPPYFSGLSPVLSQIFLVLSVLFVSWLLMIILSMEHPPAIAIILFWAFTELTSKKIIGVSICFAIILILVLLAKKFGKKDSLGGGLGSGLGGGSDLGKSMDFGKDSGGGLGSDFGKDLGGGLGKDSGLGDLGKGLGGGKSDSGKDFKL